MSVTLTAEKQEFEVIPTGEYLAAFTDYEEETGQYGEQIKITWEIEKPAKYAGKKRLDWCNKKLSKGAKTSKLWNRVEALMNRPIEIGEDVDLDSLIGRDVVLVIVEETKDDGTPNAKIASVKAYKRQEAFPKPEAGKPAAKPKAKPEDADEFEVGESDEEDPFENE